MVGRGFAVAVECASLVAVEQVWCGSRRFDEVCGVAV